MIGYADDEVVVRYGYHFHIGLKHDGSMGEPWKEHDGHGPVRYARRDCKRPSERPLELRSARGDEVKCYLYDWQGAIEKAKKEGWSVDDETAQKLGLHTKKQRRAEAVRMDFERLRGWVNDEWHWMYVSVLNVQTVQIDSISGLESDCDDYINETIDEMIESLTPLTKFERKMREIAERAKE